MDNELIECSRGPVSSMPGSRTLVAEGVARCQDHADRWAQYRVQGETDSFGCEYIHLCSSCADAERMRALIPVDGYCEWHKGEGSDIRPMRDYDEGMAGPLYDTCKACRARVNAAAAEELEESQDDYDYDPIETCQDDYDDESEEGVVCWQIESGPEVFEPEVPEDDDLGPNVTAATRMALARSGVRL